MKRHLVERSRTFATPAVLLLLVVADGCAPSLKIRATDYDVHVTVDPPAHRIAAEAHVQCVPDAILASAVPGDCASVSFELHPQLSITSVESDSLHVHRVDSAPSRADRNGRQRPTIHNVIIDKPTAPFGLTFRYEGQLQEDVQAGEKQGEIHNFAVSAHIGEDGTYLNSSGRWYPIPANDGEVGLSRFRLSVDPVDGYVFVAGADVVDEPTAAGEATVFESRFPQTDMVLIGGKYREWARESNGVRFSILLREGDKDAETLEELANLFLNAAIGYMDRYVPLVGAYPFQEFRIVENFFSSGFAFPTLTLLGPVVIQMGEKSLRHGYLDHELLHSWWGNGVYVNPDGGNWCEALASYGGNLYGYVLDGDSEGARTHRRNICNMLSRVRPEKDRPLATFGRHGGAGRGIGYQKGSMVFHMLSRKMGESNFWQAMQAMTADYTGRYADWDSIQSVFQRHTELELGPFFEQWVHGPGSPELTLDQAWIAEARSGEESEVYVRVVQNGGPFEIDLPLRIHFDGGRSEDVIAKIARASEEIRIDVDEAPAEVELDPEYHIARKVAPSEIMPTLVGCARGDQCNVILPQEDLWEGYETFVNNVEKNRRRGSMRKISVESCDTGDTSGETLVIVGNAVRDRQVQALLERSECPVRWLESGFSIDGIEYNDPGQAVLCTVRHPDERSKTITIYYGNSAESLSNAGILWFYGNSLLVFDTPQVAADAKTGDGPALRSTVIHRADFEVGQRISFEPAATHT